MEKRDFDHEKAFLDGYFSLHPETSVTLLLFSNTIWGKEQFEVGAGNWSDLESKLREVQYDGATSYADLSAYCGSNEVLLFTDGSQNLDDTAPVFSGKLTIINSLGTYDKAGLNLLTLLNNAELLNLSTRVSSAKEDKFRSYYGKIYGEYADASGMTIRIAGRDSIEVHPDAGGSYKIQALPGEVMILEMNEIPAARQSLGPEENINIWVEDSGEIRLEEVVVTERRRESSDDQQNTAYGSQKKEGIGYDVQSISDEKISDASTEATDALLGKFSGVRMGQDDQLTQVEIRSKWSILSNNYGLVVIDGVPMSKANSSFYASGSNVQTARFIDPKNIASITVLKGLAATNRYGSLGASGVILITTKTASFTGGTKNKDLALLKDNLYDGRIRVPQAALAIEYLKALKSAKNVGDAYKQYLNQRSSYKVTVAYFLDVYDYFKEAAPGLALRILTNILEKENASLPELKGLLFKAEKVGATELEMKTAERILEKFPGRIDSYLALAMAQKHAGNYQASLNLLIDMSQGGLYGNLDFSPLKKTLDREISNLVFLRKDELDLSKLPQQYRKSIRYNARIVFEWSQPQAAFSLQFVNPQKRFFSWEHGAGADSQRMRRELEQGFSREEFEIFGDGVQGEWIVNATYSGNGEATDSSPLFLRCRVVYNFGKPGQQEEEFLLRFQDNGSELQVAKCLLE